MSEAAPWDARGPLAGYRVLALEQAVAGPLCTRHLADFGADVVKVERLGGGDFARRYDTSVLGQSSYFIWLNRNKRSLALDLKHPAAREILERLVAGADVLVQNLGPGAVDRLGLAPGRLRRDYPALVVCSISGYGAGGPYEHRKAFDLLLQGETGVIATTGTPDTPAKLGISVGDIGAGVYGAMAVLAALLDRQRTGCGRLVETSLFDALSEWMGYPVLFAKYGGEPPPRAGVRHATVVPYGSYRCGDGQSVLLAVQTEGQWEAFCRVVCDRPDWLADPRYATSALRRVNRESLEAAIEDALGAFDRAQVTRRLEAADIPYGDLLDVDEFARHPQLAARRRWQPLQTPGGEIEAIVPPFDLEAAPHRMDPVPSPGEQTDAILAELGYSEGEIDRLRAEGAIG